MHVMYVLTNYWPHTELRIHISAVMDVFFGFQPDLDLTACFRCTKKTKESSNDAAVPLSSISNQTEDVNT